ncbi:MAG: nucleotidyltransferase family protein [Cyanobacteria bacterium REEB446]|jgi:predicted nucleotidyltransferase|nr:nucleotidyltransferase family protein [Cyanobacteria bacterium REEB446]
MTDLFQLIQDKKNEIKAIATKHGAYNIRVFGSVARKNFTKDSDIDFLVNFNPKTSLLDWCSLRLDLEDLLGTRVDVASEKTLKSALKEKVLAEAIDL